MSVVGGRRLVVERGRASGGGSGTLWWREGGHQHLPWDMFRCGSSVPAAQENKFQLIARLCHENWFDSDVI